MTRVLTNPEVVLDEIKRVASESVAPSEVERLNRALAQLDDREKRLVHLYTLGQVSDEAVREEGARIAVEKILIEEQLRAMQRPVGFDARDLDPDQLKRACAKVAEWRTRANDSQRTLALEALQTDVEAT